MSFKSKIVYFAIVAVLLASFTQEVECRRKILRGRRVLTRTYLYELAIPAWAILILVAIGEIIIGAVIYVIMKKVILDTPLSTLYTVAATNEV